MSTTQTFVPQNGSNQGFYIQNHHPYGNNDCYEALFTTARIDDGVQKVLASTADQTRSILMADCDSTASIIASNERTSLATQESVNRIGTLNLQATERTSAENRAALERSHAETRNLVLVEGQANKLATKDAQFELIKKTCELERQAADNAGHVKLELCKFADGLAKQAAEYNAQTQLRISESTGEIQTEALKNKAELSKELAECCCELKEKIDMRSSETQDLIRSIESQRVRDELARINQENTLLKIQIGGVSGLAARR